MKKGFLSEAHPSRQLLFSGLVVIGMWIVFQIFGIVTGIFLFNLSLNEAADAIRLVQDSRVLGFLYYVQALTSAGMFIIAAGLAAWYISPEWKIFLGLNSRPGWKISLLSVLFIIVILPFTNSLTYYNSNFHLPQFLSGLENYFRDMEEQMAGLMENFLKPRGIIGLIINLMVIAVIPAIGEELTFRGVLQKLLQRWFSNAHWAIILTAFVFSAMHIQFLSFLPRFFLGVVLGYMYYWSGSIQLTILVHLVNNATAVIFYHFYYGGYVGDFMEKTGTPDDSPAYAIIGALAGGGLLYLIYKKFKSVN